MRRLGHDTSTRAWRRRQLAVTELLRHAKIVTDPIVLENLNAQVALRRARAEGDRQPARRQPAS